MDNTPAKADRQPNHNLSLLGEAPQEHEVEDNNHFFPWCPEQDPHSNGYRVRHCGSGKSFWFESEASAINEAIILNTGA